MAILPHHTKVKHSVQNLTAALAASWILLATSPTAPADPFVVIQPPGSMILDTTLLAQCVEDFNADDRWFFGVVSDEEVSTINNGVYGGQFVKNADSYDYLKDKIPLFDCPDADFVKTYYFRWWTYRKHIKNLGTPGDPDLIVTEFIDPVGWADSSNAINAPLGHQIYEGRWLQDQRVNTGYQRYWMTHPSARPRHYSAWLSDAVLANHRVNPDLSLVTDLLTSTTNRENLEINHDNWINGVGTTGGAHRQSDGLFSAERRLRRHGGQLRRIRQAAVDQFLHVCGCAGARRDVPPRGRKRPGQRRRLQCQGRLLRPAGRRPARQGAGSPVGSGRRVLQDRLQRLRLRRIPAGPP